MRIKGQRPTDTTVLHRLGRIVVRVPFILMGRITLRP